MPLWCHRGLAYSIPDSGVKDTQGAKWTGSSWPATRACPAAKLQTQRLLSTPGFSACTPCLCCNLYAQYEHSPSLYFLICGGQLNRDGCPHWCGSKDADGCWVGVPQHATHTHTHTHTHLLGKGVLCSKKARRQCSLLTSRQPEHSC